MIEPTEQLRRPQVFYRITALWVICEAFAGGFLHAAKIPFTGMMVSSLAVCCIALLAWYVPGKGNILKATIIVAIFKLLLSPHSPPTAYIAVFFQGMMGQLLLNNKQFFRPAVVLLAVLSLAESAMQRLLVLWFVYGNSFWEAVNKFVQKLLSVETVTNYSLWIGAAYLFIHVAFAALIGSWLGSFIQNLESWKKQNPEYIDLQIKWDSETNDKPPRKKKKRFFLVLFTISLCLFYILSLVKPEWAPLPKGKLFLIFTRALVIILCWYFLLAPLIMGYLRKRLMKKKNEQEKEISHTMALLPEMKSIFQQAWHTSRSRSGLRRARLFMHIVVANAVSS